jgi:hypothetical protein
MSGKPVPKLALTGDGWTAVWTWMNKSGQDLREVENEKLVEMIYKGTKIWLDPAALEELMRLYRQRMTYVDQCKGSAGGA